MDTSNNTYQQDFSQTNHDSSATIIDRVVCFLERFIFLPNESSYRLIGTWVILTYLRDCFEFAPYLFIHSPEPSCGKSLLLEILHELVFQSSGVLISPTPAVLFRTAKGQTQLMDEVDSWQNKDELVSVLNAGFKRGGVVKRLDEKYQAKNFEVYAPRALAGIGDDILRRTTKDRTFIIAMKKQKPDERRERLHLRKLKSEIEGLKRQIQGWASTRRDEVERCYNHDEHFCYLDCFRDRTIDVAQPLAAVHEVAYRDHPQLEETRLELLEAIAAMRKDEDGTILDHRILLELLRLAQNGDPLIGTASELLQKCKDLPEGTTDEYQLSRVLRKYGFETKSVRKYGTPKYRYVLPRQELSDLVARYAGSGTAEKAQAEPEESPAPESAETVLA